MTDAELQSELERNQSYLLDAKGAHSRALSQARIDRVSRELLDRANRSGSRS